MIVAQFEPTLKGWREEARRLLIQQVTPDQVEWFKNEGNLSLFSEIPQMRISVEKEKNIFLVPKEFLEMARLVACAKDSDRWALLYRILFRLKNENAHLLKITVDKDIHRAQQLMKSVRRDMHKMHAFVRFKKTFFDDVEYYLAWHEPVHQILKETADFFVRRFGDKPWMIFTPDMSAHWDGEKLQFAEGMPQNQFLLKDDLDDLWKTYYSSIFNPARIKIKAMKAELPPKYWKSLPEVSLINDLIRSAPARLEVMRKNQNVQAQVPEVTSLAELQVAAKNCKACPLFEKAHNLVFGVGPANAEIMLIGEQPGDQEDKTGKPFVGPAGHILQQALQEINLDQKDLYLTNAVKHFKWVPHETAQGKMRLHKKPSGSEMNACKPWLEAEIKKVQPRIIVALGATAATAVLGKLPKLSDERGKIIRNNHWAEIVIVTWHPSAILRSSTPDDAKIKRQEFVQDLKLAQSLL